MLYQLSYARLSRRNFSEGGRRGNYIKNTIFKQTKRSGQFSPPDLCKSLKICVPVTRRTLLRVLHVIFCVWRESDFLTSRIQRTNFFVKRVKPPGWKIKVPVQAIKRTETQNGPENQKKQIIFHDTLLGINLK